MKELRKKRQSICNQHLATIPVGPQFSPDGARQIYRARKDGKRFVVVADANGTTIDQQPDYDMGWQPVITTDGKSIAYCVKIGKELWWKVEPVK